MVEINQNQAQVVINVEQDSASFIESTKTAYDEHLVNIEAFFAKYLLKLLDHEATISAHHHHYVRILSNIRDWCINTIPYPVPITTNNFFPPLKRPVVLPCEMTVDVQVFAGIKMTVGSSEVVDHISFVEYHEQREQRFPSSFGRTVSILLTPEFAQHFDVNLCEDNQNIHWLDFPDPEEFIQATTAWLSTQLTITKSSF